MARTKDALLGLYTNCPICGEHFFAHGMFRHMKKHGISVRFNCQGKCSVCGEFTKTNGYPESVCQNCWRPCAEAK